MLRNRPEVASWADLLADAREAHRASAAEQTVEQLAQAVEDADGERMHESA